MPADTDRKHQILEVARELLQTRGYDGFSYQDLAERVGISKPSIHHHFPTKEALGLAILQSYGQMVEALLAELDSQGAGPAGRLRAFLELGETQAVEQAHQICPGGTIHANYEVFPEALRVAARDFSADVHAWISEVLREGREAGEVFFSGKPEDEAWVLQATLMGARQQARTHGAQVWRSVSRQIEKSLLQGS